MKRSKRLVLILLMVMSFNACSNVEKQKEGIEVIDYKNPKTVCFGRAEVTIPKETIIDYGSFNYNGSDLKIDPNIKNYDQFQKYIKDKIEFYQKQPHETERSLLSREFKGPIFDQGQPMSHIIIYRSTEYSKEIYYILGVLFIKGKTILLESGASDDLLESAIADMQHTLKTIKIRSGNEKQPGLCWNELFITDDMSKDYPFFSEISFKFPSYPNVHVNLNNRVRLDSDRPLIEMIKENQNNFDPLTKAQMSYKNIRENKKEVNGLAGEEVLTYANSRTRFDRGFEVSVWQYLGEIDNPKQSFINFNLQSASSPDWENDGAMNAQISQSNILKLNDFILNSLKISQNNK